MTLFLTHTFYLLTLFIIALGAILSFNKTYRNYRPMLIFFCSLFILETAIFILGNNRDVVRTLIHVGYFIEPALVIWQAKVWGLFGNKKKWQGWLINALVVFWFLEQQLKESYLENVSLFRIVTCFIIIILAIEMLNRQLIYEKSRLWGNAIFQFSIALIFYYFYNSLLDLYMLIGINSSKETIQYTYYVSIMFAIVTNFVYLRSLLCIPKQTRFSLY